MRVPLHFVVLLICYYSLLNGLKYFSQKENLIYRKYIQGLMNELNV